MKELRKFTEENQTAKLPVNNKNDDYNTN